MAKTTDEVVLNYAKVFSERNPQVELAVDKKGPIEYLLSVSNGFLNLPPAAQDKAVQDLTKMISTLNAYGLKVRFGLGLV